MSKAVWKPSRLVAEKLPARSCFSAYATACTRMSRLPCLACHRSKTFRISSSSRTSQASTKVEPMEAASGRTRRLISDAIELKPTLAPWSYSALAIPQAIEWSLATPNTSAFLPLSRPSRTQSSAGRVRRRLTRDLATAVGTSTAAATDWARAGSGFDAESCLAAGATDRFVSFMSLVGPPLSAAPVRHRLARRIAPTLALHNLTCPELRFREIVVGALRQPVGAGGVCTCQPAPPCGSQSGPPWSGWPYCADSAKPRLPTIAVRHAGRSLHRPAEHGLPLEGSMTTGSVSALPHPEDQA